jgi:hypothetical protein
MACPSNNFSVKLADIQQGDSWGPVTFAFSTDGTALDDPLASVTMIFTDTDGNVGLSLSSASGITITDAAGWGFQTNQILEFPLAVGNWSWKLRATNDSGTRITRLAGTKRVR